MRECMQLLGKIITSTAVMISSTDKKQKERQECLIALHVMPFLFVVEKCMCYLLSCESREQRDQQYIDQMCDICCRSFGKFTLSDTLQNARLKTNVIWFQLNSRIHYPIECYWPANHNRLIQYAHNTSRDINFTCHWISVNASVYPRVK